MLWERNDNVRLRKNDNDPTIRSIEKTEGHWRKDDEKEEMRDLAWLSVNVSCKNSLPKLKIHDGVLNQALRKAAMSLLMVRRRSRGHVP